MTLGSNKQTQEIVEKTNADLKEEVLGVIEGKLEEVKQLLIKRYQIKLKKS